MATILAANTGNWSATGTWTGGVVPVAGDIVVANGKTITMDTLVVAVAELRNDTTGGAVAGGFFSLVNGSDVTANVYAGSTGTSCVQWLGSTGQTATVTGNFFGGTGNLGYGVYCNGGNLTIGGGSQATGGTSSNQAGGILFASPGTFIFATAGNPGVLTGGTSASSLSNGATCSGAGSTITIYATTITANTSGIAAGLALNASGQTANVIAGNIGTSNANALSISLSGASANFTCSVSGNITGGSGTQAYGVSITNSGTYNFTVGGNITAGSGNASQGLRNASTTATVNVTGNALGPGSVFNDNYSVNNISTGTINITGSATAGTANAAVGNVSTGTIRVTRAIGNGFGLGSVGISNVAAVFSNNSGALTYVEQLQFGSLGQTPVSGPIRLTANTGNICQMITTTGTTKTLVDTAATAGVLPAVTDVRSGVTYSSGNLTGSCAVPAAGSVALGVPVDATTGTAVLTTGNIRSAFSVELDRLVNCATVATTGQQIEDALSN